jgi:hypothetical protein
MAGGAREYTKEKRSTEFDSFPTFVTLVSCLFRILNLEQRPCDRQADGREHECC